MSSASDFIIENGILKKYVGPGGDVIIPEGVTSIGDKAFYRSSIGLKSVTILTGVTSIGEYAFYKCMYLTSVTIPDSVTSIGTMAFYGCSSLTAVTIQDLAAWCQIKYADENSNPLSRARNLYIDNGLITNLVIPESVTEIGSRTFSNCESLTSVTIPASVKIIGSHALSNCKSLKSVVLPESVELIGSRAFWNCGPVQFKGSEKALALLNRSFFAIENGGLQYDGPGGDVVIPEGVTRIGNRAFSWCSNLISVTIPDSVTSIGDEAFYGCSGLTSVTIPDSVTSIGGSAFYGCKSLASVTIPENVTEIGQCAFSRCGGLTKVRIPDSVSTIGMDAFDRETALLIRDISRLPAPLRPNAVVGFAENGGTRETPEYEVHAKYIKTNAAKLVSLAMEHPALLSLMCREKLITPKNMELYVNASQKTGNAELIAMMLDYQANKISTKQKENLEKRKEKEQDTIIDRTIARQDQEGIEGLNIAVTSRLETFDNRDALKAFLLEKGAKLTSSLTSKVDYLIMTDRKSDTAKASKAQELGIEIIEERCFNELAGRVFDIHGSKLQKYCGTATEVIIPDAITEIGEKAFYKYSGLTRVIIPEGVIMIGDMAFSHCGSLTSASLPQTLTEIGGWAFHECFKLTDVTIPERVTRIEYKAFSWCSSLTSITLPVSLATIGGEAFCGCSGLTRMTIPASVTSIGSEAFSHCPKLTIHAPAGSYAEQYAKKHNIPFVAE